MRYLYRPLPPGVGESNPLADYSPVLVRGQVCEITVICLPYQGPFMTIPGVLLIQYGSWEQFYENWMPEPFIEPQG